MEIQPCIGAHTKDFQLLCRYLIRFVFSYCTGSLRTRSFLTYFSITTDANLLGVRSSKTGQFWVISASFGLHIWESNGSQVAVCKGKATLSTTYLIKTNLFIFFLFNTYYLKNSKKRIVGNCNPVILVLFSTE